MSRSIRRWRRLVQIARLCCSSPDCDNHVRHLPEKHPDREATDYSTFFRDGQEVRFSGRNRLRCC